ncbi:long chain base biosynthesis protein 1-like isoform X4 [Malus sylvestris]|uniref:long chain base biosynthesis protein 1-like isoform X4 n=1 Tax=Malus sylvestris TaxID=3752 RepID=UPI0021ABD445|nr:long chain base biosynthesis protein 1-like isoform X4 [Malus sylvestris]
MIIRIHVTPHWKNMVLVHVVLVGFIEQLNSGQIASLDKIVELKEKYKLHVLLDESNSFGVLGKTGRGLTEYCGIPVFLESLLFFQYLVEKIDVITAAMGHALATEGGFCTGSARVTYRQVVART